MRNDDSMYLSLSFENGEYSFNSYANTHTRNLKQESEILLLWLINVMPI